MNRNSAHGDRLARIFAPLCERDIEARRGQFRIFEEQLEKVAHPIEKQSVASFVLEATLLGHHRGWSIGSSHC
jgi:hypothetical protein